MNEKLKDLTPEKFKQMALEWGSEDPKQNAQLVKYGVGATMLCGVGLIGPLAILALAGKGAYDILVESESYAHDKFLAERLKNDPEFVDKLRERVLKDIHQHS